jgi:hypothetical protein
MPIDPIVEEIHAIREALSKASGDDIRKIAEAARERQARSGAQSVEPPPRRARITAIGLPKATSELPHSVPRPTKPASRSGRRSAGP